MDPTTEIHHYIKILQERAWDRHGAGHAPQAQELDRVVRELIQIIYPEEA